MADETFGSLLGPPDSKSPTRSIEETGMPEISRIANDADDLRPLRLLPLDDFQDELAVLLDGHFPPPVYQSLRFASTTQRTPGVRSNSSSSGASTASPPARIT
jgi:hypothetical protein